MKGLQIDCARYIAVERHAEPKLVELPLHLTFFLRALRNDKVGLLDRYNAGTWQLDQALRALYAKQLLLGPKELVPAAVLREKRYTVFEHGVDAASLGVQLIRVTCPPILAAHKLGIERLSVAFGVFERADCTPRNSPVLITPWQQDPPKDDPEDDVDAKLDARIE